MEDFKREIARRADAAATTYLRERDRPIRARQRARKSLAEVRKRFVQAALHSDSCLRVYYQHEPGTNRALGYMLAWTAFPPRRQLCIRLGEDRAMLEWELVSPELGISRASRVDALDFRP
jgi:hypothetical protein